MKGGFFAGLALGAIMGAIMLEISPDAKQLVEKGQNMIEKNSNRKSNFLFDMFFGPFYKVRFYL